MAIEVKDDIGYYFQTKKDYAKVKHYRLYYSHIVADMLAVIIERAKLDSQIETVVPHLVDGGLSILQYADYTILFRQTLGVGR